MAKVKNNTSKTCSVIICSFLLEIRTKERRIVRKSKRFSIKNEQCVQKRTLHYHCYNLKNRNL